MKHRTTSKGQAYRLALCDSGRVLRLMMIKNIARTTNRGLQGLSDIEAMRDVCLRPRTHAGGMMDRWRMGVGT